MRDFEETMNRLNELHDAVRNYLTWYDTDAEGQEPCDRELDYWLEEMRRLTDD